MLGKYNVSHIHAITTISNNKKFKEQLIYKNIVHFIHMKIVEIRIKNRKRNNIKHVFIMYY